jgi:hypothetical protein
VVPAGTTDDDLTKKTLAKYWAFGFVMSLGIDFGS